jgi:hypothetical protein
MFCENPGPAVEMRTRSRGTLALALISARVPPLIGEKGACSPRRGDFSRELSVFCRATADWALPDVTRSKSRRAIDCLLPNGRRQC